jgi:hypothetical protein
MGTEDAILIERTHGVINPPPDIKKIIDKAAGLVAKYGSNIESMMKNEDKNLPKFSFLKPGDPYRAYYDYKVNQLSKQSNLEKKETEENLMGKKTMAENDLKIEFTKEAANEKKKFLIKDEIKIMLEEVRKERDIDNKVLPQDQYSVVHPNISPLDM